MIGLATSPALVRPNAAPTTQRGTWTAFLLARAAATAPARASLPLSATAATSAAVGVLDPLPQTVLLPLSQTGHPLLLREVELPIRAHRSRLIVSRGLEAPCDLLHRERVNVEECLD
jgi:hypothetical protein